MDPIDRRLLSILHANARVTFAELARQVQMSAPAVHDRVARLEAAGLISGYHAAIAPEAFGLHVTALLGIYLSEGTDQDELASMLERLPGIEDCWLVAGDEAFVVKVRVPEMARLEALLGQLRRTPGVARIRTNIVLSTRWEGRLSTSENEPVADS